MKPRFTFQGFKCRGAPVARTVGRLLALVVIVAVAMGAGDDARARFDKLGHKMMCCWNVITWAALTRIPCAPNLLPAWSAGTATTWYCKASCRNTVQRCWRLP